MNYLDPPRKDDMTLLPVLKPVMKYNLSSPIAGGGGGGPVPVNLVTNGTFDDSSAWTLGMGWSIAGGTCNREASGGGTVITQPIALVAGTQYLVEFDVISISGGPINARFTGGTTVIASTITTAGKYSVLMTALTGNNTLMIAASIGGIVCSIDNVTVTEA